MPKANGQFDSWAAHHGGLIARVAASYEREPALTEELVQDILLALWRAHTSFRGDSSVRTFVARVANNVCISHVRRAAKVEFAPLDEALPDRSDDPDVHVDAALRRARLVEAVRALPLSLRQVITLHLEGMSGAEIAQALDITENNVGVRLMRARTTLRKKLDGWQK